MSISFCYAYMDVVCYLRMGLFATVMTGNTIFFARQVVIGNPYRALHYGLTIVAYSIGAMLFQLTRIVPALHFRTSASMAGAIMLLCAVIVDGVFMGMVHRAPANLTSCESFEREHVGYRWDVWLISFGFGCVGSTSMFVTNVTTNAVTGSIQKASVTAINWCFGLHLPNEVRGALTAAGQIVAFVAGVTIGAAVVGVDRYEHPCATQLFRDRGYFAIAFVPAAAVLAISLVAHDFTYAEEIKAERSARHARWHERPSAPRTIFRTDDHASDSASAPLTVRERVGTYKSYGTVKDLHQAAQE